MKSLIQLAGMLTHYDPNREMIVTCDASTKGVGAVLYHIMPDGTERPVVMASRSLSPAEKNYSQIDREALALTFAAKKFHQYVYAFLGQFTYKGQVAMNNVLVVDHEGPTLLGS